MADRSHVIGVDLGGTHMQVGVVDASGGIVARAGHKTLAERGAADVLDRVAHAVRSIADDAGIGIDAVAAVGIGVPGALDRDSRRVLVAQNLRWVDVDALPALRERLPGTTIVMENDVNVAAYGENRLGCGRNSRDALGVWIGTGIGAGWILDGALYPGHFGTAGEIGLTVLFPDAPYESQRMEFLCSRKFVAKQIADRARAGETVAIPDIERITSADLVRAYDAGCDVTRDVIDRGTFLVGVAIANAVTLMAVPVVMLGGGLSEAMGQPYADRVLDAVKPHVHPPQIGERLEVRVTELRENAGLLGAAMLALDSA